VNRLRVGVIGAVMALRIALAVECAAAESVAVAP